jgi:hypothetical protein
VLAEVVEVETGKGADALDRCPKLAEALAKAKPTLRLASRDSDGVTASMAKR